MSPRTLRACAVAAVVLGGACRQRVPLARVVEDQHDLAVPAPAFLDVSFEQIFDEFLRPGQDPRAHVGDWVDHYKGRWVRWRGEVRWRTPRGLYLRQLPTTVVYDVVLDFEAADGADARSPAPGDVVTYAGRLVRYDYDFEVVYLDHGYLVEE